MPRATRPDHVAERAMEDSSDAPPAFRRAGPRERLRALAGEALTDDELLAVLLGTGGSGRPVLDLAALVLDEVGGLDRLAEVGVDGLASIPGIGPSKASRIVAAVELGRRILTRPLPRGRRLLSARDVDAALRPRLARATVEHFLALPLDAKNRPMGEIRVATGGLSACPVNPADVFRPLLRCAASAVVFVHNHPSGSPDPSPEDRALTRRLARAGDLLGVRVLDHVIIGHEGYFSFLDAGWMDPEESEE